MIAIIDHGDGRREYVALHRDPRTHARDVWVTIRGDRGASGEQTLMLAIWLCVLDLHAIIGPLIADAQALSRMADHRSFAGDDEGLIRPRGRGLRMRARRGSWAPAVAELEAGVQ